MLTVQFPDGGFPFSPAKNYAGGIQILGFRVTDQTSLEDLSKAGFRTQYIDSKEGRLCLSLRDVGSFHVGALMDPAGRLLRVQISQ